MPASNPQTAYCSSAEPPERDAGRDRDEHAGQHLDADEALDLLVDFVEDLHRDLLLRQLRTGDLHELALVEIAGDQEEVDEEQNHGELADETHEASPADPDVVRGSERRLDDLHPLNSARPDWRRLGRRRVPSPPGRSSRFLWRPLHLLQRAVSILPPVAQALTDALRGDRNVADDRDDFVAERVDARGRACAMISTTASCRAERPRHAIPREGRRRTEPARS